uniref:RING-type E3 ubiquitin transferase n=1 Tax=Schistocephalus solidus TaxID=70667 RepID=A0A0V0J4H7_SCHSO
MDLTCPICLNVFFKPIRLPCEHVVCQNCLELSLDISNLTCPICRFRLSNWKRRLKDTSVCIDKVRDRKIQRLFPLYYSNRSAGMDVSLDGCEMSLYNSISESVNTRRPTDTPGSVALEFEASLQRIRNNKKAYESLQEEASLALARQLLLETGGDEDSLDCYASVNCQPIVSFFRKKRKTSDWLTVLTLVPPSLQLVMLLPTPHCVIKSLINPSPSRKSKT